MCATVSLLVEMGAGTGQGFVNVMAYFQLFTRRLLRRAVLVELIQDRHTVLTAVLEEMMKNKVGGNANTWVLMILRSDSLFRSYRS